MQSQDEASNEGKSEAKRWKPGCRAYSQMSIKRGGGSNHEEQASSQHQGKADPQGGQTDYPPTRAENGLCGKWWQYQHDERDQGNDHIVHDVR